MLDSVEEVEDTASERLNEICAMAWDRHGFDRLEFASLVTQQILSSRDSELIHLVLYRQALVEHGDLKRQENERLLHNRTSLVREPEVVVDAARVSAERQMRAATRKNNARADLFKWRWGVDAKPIGDMTRDDLLTIASTEESKARNVLDKCTYLRRIAELVQDGMTVIDCVTAEQLERIRDEVFGAAGSAA